MEAKNIQLSESKSIYLLDYPFADTLNPAINKIILGNSSLSDRGTMQTDWFSQFEEFTLIAAYVKTFLQLPRFQIGIHNCKLVLTSLWGMIYNPGDHQTIHDHLPCHWAFVYYVCTPENSPPLVFDDCSYTYYPKAGQIVIFPAALRHHVPLSTVSGRTNIVGNFYYQADPKTIPSFGV